MEEFLWVSKYRPRTVKDTILPASLKETLQSHLSKGELPNFLFSGGSGIGKTTVAKALVNEVGGEFMMINGSLSGNIDTLRNEILSFASSMSLEGGRKYVILDEADYLNANSTQPALRNFMEEFSRNCGFILTCNFKERILPALQSRCAVVEFTIPNSEKPELAKQFMARCIEILDENKIAYEPAVVAEVIKKYIPDWRRVLNELQRYSATGKIDSGILSQFTDEPIKDLFQFIKDKNFTSVRKWVAENDNMSPTELFRRIYEHSVTVMEAKSIPPIVLILAKYSYQSAFVADQQINTTACIIEIMVEGRFK